MGSKKVQGPSKRELVGRLEALQEIAVDLLKERNLHHLLDLVVTKAMRIMFSDAGSLFLKDPSGGLIFEVCRNDSCDYPFQKKHIPLSDHGIANYCFKTCQPLRVDDVRNLSDDLPFSFDEDWDNLTGYRTKSILAYPLYSSKNDVLGVIQIINRKNKVEENWPSQDENLIAKMPSFNIDDENLLKSFASLASAAIENAGLYKEINSLLEGFVKASVKAIESRDPTTSGHSERVAVLTTTLAENISRAQDSDLKEFHLTTQQLKELHYASLLHDFGKICIKEDVILKAEKLYPTQKSNIKARVQEFGHAGEIRYLNTFIKHLIKEKRPPTELEVARVKKDISKYRQEINARWKDVLELNRTSILDEDNSTRLEQLRGLKFPLLNGKKVALVENEELEYLSIKRGSITDDERDEINRHVTHTYEILKEIPWGQEFNNLVQIAYAHHEKMDGTGYPRGLKDQDIPFQAKIMTVADIFDALVAWDRPYKKAIPFEKALEILEMEAKEGKLHPSFVRIFIESKVYEHPEFLQNIRGQEHLQRVLKRSKKKRAA